MKKQILLPEWNEIEQALMKAEIPYKVSFDSHACMDGCRYEKIIEISPFSIVNFINHEEEKEDG